MKAMHSDIIVRYPRSLNIIEEYAALSVHRKLLLCDRLFIEGRNAFMSTVRLLWPEASDKDARKLEKFLILLKRAGH